MELKDWVHQARKHKGWTMAQLAEAMGRSKSNVGLWEAGNHSPSYEQVQQIAVETGFPLPHEVELDDSGKVVGLSKSDEEFRGRLRVAEDASIDGTHFKRKISTLGGHLRGINAKNALAIRMKGDGGHPVIKHHQFLVVIDGGRPAFGELCLVDTNYEHTQILEFLSEQDDFLVFSSLNNDRISIQKESIVQLWPVIAIASQSLWQPDTKP